MCCTINLGSRIIHPLFFAARRVGSLGAVRGLVLLLVGAALRQEDDFRDRARQLWRGAEGDHADSPVVSRMHAGDPGERPSGWRRAVTLAGTEPPDSRLGVGGPSLWAMEEGALELLRPAILEAR